MAATFLSEEQFLCSVCLDVFTNPITIPCGHNFCQTCIQNYWGTRGAFQCPLCMKTFAIRPDLTINTTLKEIVEHFDKMRLSVEEPLKPGDVPCDICPETNFKALKSCLVCLASYCHAHLEPHQRVVTLKGHKLVDPVKNLENRICKRHGKPLEMFCRDEQVCVCVLCSQMDHSTHNIVAAETAWNKIKTDLEKREREVQQMIHKRQEKAKEIWQVLELSNTNTEREFERIAQVYSSLLHFMERSQAQLATALEVKRRATERRAHELIYELEWEIGELQSTNAELKQLLHTEDHVHFLQRFPFLCVPPHTRDWAAVTVHHEMCVGMLRQSLTDLGKVIKDNIKAVSAADLSNCKKNKVDVTLDRDTAHANLILSEAGKQVRLGENRQTVPDNPERFNPGVCVLGKPAFSSGRIYYEVWVGEITEWDIGIATESVNRKGKIIASPEDGFWTIWLRNGTEYLAPADPSVPLSLSENLRKVGVYLDYEEGQVSFYNAETSSHLCSYIGYTFTEKLYPFFSPCSNTNSDPLIITHVDDINYY